MSDIYIPPGGGGGNTTATYTTEGDEHVALPNSYQLKAGSNITLTPASGSPNTLTITSSGGTATPGGSIGQIQYNNSGALGGFTMSGDATTNTSTGAITVTKTSGVAFATSATTDTTNASNITSGTLPAAQLPNPTSSTLGGIESLAAVSHKWINTISTSGVPSATQPAFTDISGTATAAQMLALTDTHIYVGNGSNQPADVAMSGDATMADTGALTLATVNSNVGSYTSANITVDGKGRITAAANGSGGSGITGLYGDITTAQSTSGNITSFDFGQTEVITPTISSSQNNWSPSGWLSSSLPQANVIRITNATSILDITGLVPPTYNIGTSGTAEGFKVTIAVASGSSQFPVRLVANSGSSTAANQFGFPSNVYLAPGEDLTLIYDATASLWREYHGHKDIRTDYYGTGSDGNVTISSGTTTLTHDMYYENLTITGGSLCAAGCRIFVRGMLDISSAPTGAIKACAATPGGNGGATGGAGSAIGQTNPALNALDAMLAWGQVGFSGGAGTVTTGGQGSNNVVGTFPNIVTGANSGAGGAGLGGTNAGGANRAGRTPTNTVAIPMYTFAYSPYANFSPTSTTLFTAIGGQPGGGGGGDGTVSGGGGGAGGTGPSLLDISARYIYRGSNTNTGVIQAIGNAGGNGGSPASGTGPGGGGGGAGTGGGTIVVSYSALLGSTITNGIDITGGAGGVGGNAQGTGAGGNGGGAGPGGKVTLINLTSGTVTDTTSAAAAVAGNAASGTTGGGAAAATTAQANL